MNWEFSEYISKILLNEDLSFRMSKVAEAKANRYSSETFGNKVLNAHNKAVNYSLFVHTKDRAFSVNY